VIEIPHSTNYTDPATVGHQSTGRQTNWATVNWVTNQPGDDQLGDNIWSTRRQIIKLLFVH